MKKYLVIGNLSSTLCPTITQSLDKINKIDAVYEKKD